MADEIQLIPSSYEILAFPAKHTPDQYLPLIFSKWLRSLRFGSDAFKHIESTYYYREYHKFIESLLEKPDAIVRLAVLSDNHDVVLGFSVSREDVLDYIHVHLDQRRQGIAKKLAPIGITAFTHYTNTAGLIWRSEKYKHLEFKPHI